MFKDFQRPRERKASSLGSGFIIKDGIVITNNHVIAGADDILIKVNTKEYNAKVLGADPYMDVAVLKIETKDKFTRVNLETQIMQELETGLLQSVILLV